MVLETDFAEKAPAEAHVGRVPTNDRRILTRRTEDFHWIERISDLTGDGCFVVASTMQIEYANANAVHLLDLEDGAPPADFALLVKELARAGYFGPGDPDVFVALFTDMLTNQRLRQSGETQLIKAITPTGRHIEMHMTHGRDDRYLLFVRDRTQIFLERQALATALELGDSGYWYLNLETQEFLIRAEALQAHFAPNTFAGNDMDSLRKRLHPDDRARADAAITDSIRTKSPTTIVARLIDDNKEAHWLRSHIKPELDETNRVRSLICYFTDITTQLRVQDELRAAQERAERALKGKNAFLSRLSHEVRTPMNAVIGMADALLHHHNDPTINPKLTLIQDSAEKIVRLVDETLQHSKLEEEEIELNPREASPAEVVSQACAMWNEQATRAGTTLTCTIKEGVPEHILFDDFRFEQCLNNLLSNAVKFTEGGRVDVVLAASGGVNSRQLVLAVRDTGIGMDSEQLKQVFVPYKQADKSISSRYGGTGLGMAITKDLVELMEGRITVRSKPGEGTIFVLTLPIATAQDTKTMSNALVGDILQTSQTAEPSDYSDMRILLVDDNKTNHTVVTSLLGTLVGHIDTALNGEEAIERLKQETFDVVLMDIHMPVMDGIEATLAIRSSHASYADVPIVALTADPQYQQARLCKNIGMDDALAKPIRLSNLLQSFDRVRHVEMQHAA